MNHLEEEAGGWFDLKSGVSSPREGEMGWFVAEAE